MLDQLFHLVQHSPAMHGIATVGRVGKLVEVVSNTGKLMTYPAQFIGNAWPIMPGQFRTGQEGAYPVGGCGMAMSAGDMVPAIQFSRAGSDREAGSSGNRHNRVLLKGGQRGKYSPLPDAEWVAIQHCWLLLKITY
ncbi:hypothetical protein HK27_07505 [Acetobacter orientalis]|nr:hypothetical protein HK27_07505 [Acetobacter orientalis]